MGFAHHFPGLGLTVEQLAGMARADIDALRVAGKKVLDTRSKERWAHTEVLAAALGVKLR